MIVLLGLEGLLDGFCFVLAWDFLSNAGAREEMCVECEEDEHRFIPRANALPSSGLSKVACHLHVRRHQCRARHDNPSFQVT